MSKPPDYQAIGDLLFRALPEDVGDVVLMFEDGDGRLHCISTAPGDAATKQMIVRLLRGNASSFSIHSSSEEH